MKIAIVGYGKMGRRIAELAPVYGFEVGEIIDNESEWSEKAEKLSECAVAFEFSTPDTAKHNVMRLLEMGLDVVCGTTGWGQGVAEAEELALSKGKGLMVVSNFSIGMNLFFLINRYVGDLMSSLPGYEPSIKEIHHVHKLDTPSGTARTMADDLQQVIAKAKKGGSCGCGCNDVVEVPIESIREGEVTGTHSVKWAGSEDIISVQHEALNRDGFVKGALAAARWLHGRKGSYSMYDLLFEPKE